MIASAPLPFRPWILCPDRAKLSIPRSFRLAGRRIKPWTPSTCSQASGHSFLTRALTSRMGWMAPVSLLTSITQTRRTSSASMPSKAARFTLPSGPRGMPSATKPCGSAWQAPLTLECSPREYSALPPSRILSVLPRIARLLASVPPEVKITRSACSRSFRKARPCSTRFLSSTAGL